MAGLSSETIRKAKVVKETMQPFFEAYEKEIFQLWKKTADKETREFLHGQIVALEAIRNRVEEPLREVATYNAEKELEN